MRPQIEPGLYHYTAQISVEAINSRTSLKENTPTNNLFKTTSPVNLGESAYKTNMSLFYTLREINQNHQEKTEEHQMLTFGIHCRNYNR